MAEEKTDFDALKQRCFLDGYVTGRKETKKRDDSEYQITFFQGDHSTEYMVAEMKDGEVDGTVQLFDKGVIQLSWTCEKGKRKGGFWKFLKNHLWRQENLYAAFSLPVEVVCTRRCLTRSR